MNMEGLSEATIEKLFDSGFIHSFADIFHLKEHADEICKMDGFGEKSCSNLMPSIDKARKVKLPALIYALGIPGIGVANAKVLARAFTKILISLGQPQQKNSLRLWYWRCYGIRLSAIILTIQKKWNS